MLIAIGRISGTHGLRGDVKVESFSGEYDHFDFLETVLLRKDGRERQIAVQAVKRSGGKAVVSLAGIESVEDAARLRGWELWASREQAAPLRNEEYYIADVIGLSVTEQGETLGSVTAVYDGGQGELLEVDLGERKALLPFLAVYVKSVDLEAGRIELWERWILE
ncbi:MAG: ribosome maturation factor RimM [Spirochaetaceae bacterium]